MGREDLIKLARSAVAGVYRVLDDGITETRLPDVANPAEFNPPEWVLDAMDHAYERGFSDGRLTGPAVLP